MPERLQKWLAGQGLGSRRHMESMIAEGRITINGKVAEVGCKVSGDERITVDGRLLRQPRRHKFRSKAILYHKPSGEICTRSDPQGRPTVFDHLPHLAHGRWISVGRLDFQTSGVLLLTNDGQLANRLMHPSAGLAREYSVRVHGSVEDAMLKKLRRGLELDDGKAKFDKLEFAGGEGRNRWYKVVVSEGRNRLVRRLWEATGCSVSRLIRIRYGPVSLPRSLRAGKSRFLNPGELTGLYEAAGMEEPVD
ncbi:MAG TPA: pseudouridine synthase [Gammaproteobacteria bacterium]|jgi:23S rRNA pseudouridine2605 synthase|nr:23S rRNA pseudouridylate synthase B [Chromatiales bacterium]MCP4925397.1 rRNA pseudouridine synthase [Gammaproteobacteria bacterium]HJP39976.1 pseudouridine synthase [Gammaproteobacteria bacterium]